MEELDMCPQDHGSVQDKDRDLFVPASYLQKSKGRRLTEAAHVVGVGERRCYASCGLSGHHKR